MLLTWNVIQRSLANSSGAVASLEMGTTTCLSLAKALTFLSLITASNSVVCSSGSISSQGTTMSGSGGFSVTTEMRLSLMTSSLEPDGLVRSEGGGSGSPFGCCAYTYTSYLDEWCRPCTSITRSSSCVVGAIAYETVLGGSVPSTHI
jgi:hypothetical protein